MTGNRHSEINTRLSGDNSGNDTENPQLSQTAKNILIHIFFFHFTKQMFFKMIKLNVNSFISVHYSTLLFTHLLL